MIRILLDTNVLISFLTDRNRVQQEQAARLFEAAAARQHELVLHLVAATETCYVLQNLYGVPASEVARILRDLLAAPGVVPACQLDWSRLLELWPRDVPAFADAALAAAAGPGDEVATFDAALAKRLRRLGTPVRA